MLYVELNKILILIRDVKMSDSIKMEDKKIIKILLADDHSIVRAGLIRIIEECDDMDVIAEASNGKEALELAKEHMPDVAILDISMPELDGLEVVDQLKSSYPDLPTIVLTMHEEEQYAVRAIEVGAMGYITKQSAPDQLVDAIRKVYSGSRYLSESATEALALRIAKGTKKQTLLDTLSRRELQVLRRLALGHTNHEICESYNISVKTVDTYRFRVLKKLKLRNNAELSRFAIQNNIIEP